MSKPPTPISSGSGRIKSSNAVRLRLEPLFQLFKLVRSWEVPEPEYRRFLDLWSEVYQQLQAQTTADPKGR